MPARHGFSASWRPGYRTHPRRLRRGAARRGTERRVEHEWSGLAAARQWLIPTVLYLECAPEPEPRNSTSTCRISASSDGWERCPANIPHMHTPCTRQLDHDTKLGQWPRANGTCEKG